MHIGIIGMDERRKDQGAVSLVPRLSPHANEKSNWKRQKAGWGLGMRLGGSGSFVIQ